MSTDPQELPAPSDELRSGALAYIPVGVIVERRKADSPWQEFLYRPIAVLPGSPTATPWTAIRLDGETTTFYAGQAVIELHRTETANYRDNLASGKPLVWVVLRPLGAEGRFNLLMATVDPAEGEALTGAGDDLVESVPMTAPMTDLVQQFVAEHHVEQPFFKRQRERSGSQSTSTGTGASKESE